MFYTNKIQKAIDFAVSIANDNSHGYDQAHRDGKPDFDCSSLMIASWENAGVKVKEAGATYTGNMKSAFLKCGFEEIIDKVNIKTGSGLVAGDVLLHEGKHTAIYIGNGKIVHASINEKGKIVGGKPGDQTGREICVRSYYNHPWNAVLRYADEIKYSKIATTHVLEIPPMLTKAAAIKGTSASIAKKYKSFVCANFFGKAIIGWLISDGIVLSERHEEGKSWEKPKGTVIVYKNGKTECGLKTDTEMVRLEEKIQFCCQGFNLFPFDLKKEGFVDDKGNPDTKISRSCNRVAIGYNKSTNKIILAVRPSSDAQRARQTLINLGCDSGICLDSGSSCNLYVDGKALFKTDSVLTNIITF